MISLKQVTKGSEFEEVKKFLQEDQRRLMSKSLREWDEECKRAWRESMEYHLKNRTTYDQNGLNC